MGEILKILPVFYVGCKVLKSKINIHFIYILSAAALWGIAGIYVRTLENTAFTQMGIVFGRSFFTAMVLALFIFFKDKNLFKVKLKDMPWFIGDSVFSIILFNFSYYKTMSLTSLSVAAVLLYTAPFFVVIISAFLFKERITLKKVTACIIAFIGCLFVSGVFSSQNRITLPAIIFGLLTGFGYALYTVFGRILIDKGYNTFTITFYIFFFSAICGLPFINMVDTFTVMFSSSKVLITIFLMAVFNTVVPYMLYTGGLLGVETSVAPIICTLEPVVATVTGVVLYKEPLNFLSVLGIVLFLGSVIILNLKVGKNEN